MKIYQPAELLMYTVSSAGGVSVTLETGKYYDGATVAGFFASLNLATPRPLDELLREASQPPITGENFDAFLRGQVLKGTVAESSGAENGVRFRRFVRLDDGGRQYGCAEDRPAETPASVAFEDAVRFCNELNLPYPQELLKDEPPGINKEELIAALKADPANKVVESGGAGIGGEWKIVRGDARRSVVIAKSPAGMASSEALQVCRELRVAVPRLNGYAPSPRDLYGAHGVVDADEAIEATLRRAERSLAMIQAKIQEQAERSRATREVTIPRFELWQYARDKGYTPDNGNDNNSTIVELGKPGSTVAMDLNGPPIPIEDAEKLVKGVVPDEILEGVAQNRALLRAVQEQAANAGQDPEGRPRTVQEEKLQDAEKDVETEEKK